MPAASLDLTALVGRSPDQLTYIEKRRYAGVWVAYEVYSPATVPLRKIEAAADSVAACVAQITARGLDPRNYEFTLLQPPVAW